MPLQGEGMGEVRARVAGELGGKMSSLLGKAQGHDSAALRRLAVLRRGVGRSFGADAEASGELTHLVALPPGSPAGVRGGSNSVGRLVDDVYLVATLVAFTRVRVPRKKDGDERNPWGSFGRDLRSLERKRTGSGERLLRPILRAPRVDLDYHLRRAFSLLASDGLAVDVTALVRELGGWEDDREWVQKRWAYHFWVGREVDVDMEDGLNSKGAVQG